MSKERLSRNLWKKSSRSWARRRKMAAKIVKVIGILKMRARLALQRNMNSKTLQYWSSTLKTITKEIKRSNSDSYLSIVIRRKPGSNQTLPSNWPELIQFFLKSPLKSTKRSSFIKQVAWRQFPERALTLTGKPFKSSITCRIRKILKARYKI